MGCAKDFAAIRKGSDRNRERLRVELTQLPLDAKESGRCDRATLFAYQFICDVQVCTDRLNIIVLIKCFK